MQDYSKSKGGFSRKGNSSGFHDKGNPVKDWLKEHNFSPTWITYQADSAMVIYTEEAGKFMAKNGLTNSKIRSVYGEIKRIQMGKYEEEKTSFILLRPKVAYAYGRDDRNRGLELFKSIFDNASTVVNDQKSFYNFCSFFEAILAYHKAYGGKD